MAPPTGRGLKRFRLAHKKMWLLKRQVPQVNDAHAHMPLATTMNSS